jgi:hypothetical protein
MYVHIHAHTCTCYTVHSSTLSCRGLYMTLALSQISTLETQPTFKESLFPCAEREGMFVSDLRVYADMLVSSVCMCVHVCGCERNVSIKCVYVCSCVRIQ